MGPEGRVTSRLTRLHPYPAMVADTLAVDLATKYVAPGACVLDPFCGSGRLLAATPYAAHRTGLDVNPLAWLLTKAKLGSPSIERLEQVAANLSSARTAKPTCTLETAFNGGVEWFPRRSIQDLEHLVAYIDAQELPEAEHLLVAAAFSATVREVSFARQHAWKLHRMDAAGRASFAKDAVDVLRRRLDYCIRSIQTGPTFDGGHDVRLCNAQDLSALHDDGTRYDVVLTSPPYGDSRTTVQYGAASALCLHAVSHLRGLDRLRLRGSSIDGACLGGVADARDTNSYIDLDRYWPDGEPRVRTLVARFVASFERVMAGIAGTLRSDGKAILIVGNRSVGGARFALDELTIDMAGEHGLLLVESDVRRFGTKRVPRRVNRFGRSADADTRANGIITTMEEEIILVFRRR